MPPAERSPHRRRRFTGRDPDERHRASTPLELLYDLTVVVAFGAAADELAHAVAEGHALAGVAGFCLAAFSVSWAWLNYSWFASAYDTDDWVFRLATFVQMAGVIVLALGVPPLFASIAHGETLDNGVAVAGYVLMRVSLVLLWAQVARQDPVRAPAARAYMTVVVGSQVLWILSATVDSGLAVSLAAIVVLTAVEMTGPALAERRAATPWHPRHIAERYGLLVIITLGEVLIGTVASLNAILHGTSGWSVDGALVLVAGVGLTFATWWMYFAVPWAEPLSRRRERGFAVGYGHLVLFASLAAIGAGLHVAAYALEDRVSGVTTTGVVAAVAIPVAVFTVTFYGVYIVLLRGSDAVQLAQLAAALACVGLAVALAAAGVAMPICLLVLLIAPVVTVVGYEAVGHGRIERHLEAL